MILEAPAMWGDILFWSSRTTATRLPSVDGARNWGGF